MYFSAATLSLAQPILTWMSSPRFKSPVSNSRYLGNKDCQNTRQIPFMIWAAHKHLWVSILGHYLHCHLPVYDSNLTKNPLFPIVFLAQVRPYHRLASIDIIQQQAGYVTKQWAGLVLLRSGEGDMSERPIGVDSTIRMCIENEELFND